MTDDRLRRNNYNGSIMGLSQEKKRQITASATILALLFGIMLLASSLQVRNPSAPVPIVTGLNKWRGRAAINGEGSRHKKDPVGVLFVLG